MFQSHKFKFEQKELQKNLSLTDANCPQEYNTSTIRTYIFVYLQYKLVLAECIYYKKALPKEDGE
jgi:hypothetical protein